MKTVAFVRTTSIYNDSRATKEISALAKDGYRVVVLGWDRNGKSEENCRREIATDRVDFRFFKAPIPNGIGVRNMDKLFAWFRWVKKQLSAIGDLSAVHAVGADVRLGSADRNGTVVHIPCSSNVGSIEGLRHNGGSHHSRRYF